MSARRKAVIFVAATVTLLVIYLAHHLWAAAKPRREALEALNHLEAALRGTAPEALLEAVRVPGMVAGRTIAEQAEFLRKALRDEISSEGVAVLGKKGRFGPLGEVFPDEAEGWARQGRVDSTNCVAFRMEREGVRAEVVLVRQEGFGAEEPPYRVLRCNNVMQMAMDGLEAGDKRP